MKKIVLLLGCLLPLTILAACGGGGSASTATATTAVTGPQVVYTTPLDGDTGVAVTTLAGTPAPITVTFDRAMDPATVTASDALVSAASGIGNHTVTLTYFDTVTSSVTTTFSHYTTNTGNFVVKGTLTHDATNKVFTFTPTSPLTAFAINQINGLSVPTHQPRTFKLTIKGGVNGVKDAGGNAMVPGGPTNSLDHVTTFTIWAGTQQSGTVYDDVVNGVGADSGGNIYMAGYTNGSLGTATNAGEGVTSDILVTKYDPNGALLWTVQQGSTAGFNDRALGLAVDTVSATPQLVIAGYTDGTLSMSAIANSDPNGNTHNYFVMTSDLDGTATNIRATQAGIGKNASGVLTAVSSVGRAVATDSSGNIYVTGETYGNLRTGLNVYTATYQGDGTTSDVFLAKYDKNLTLQWTRVFGSSGNDVAYGVAVDASSNVFITGTTTGSLSGANKDATGTTTDIFVAKFDTGGTQRWLSQLGTASNDIANAVTVDSTGKVYVAGGTNGSLFGANADNTATAGTTSDLFVAQFDNGTGGTVWTRQMGTSYNDTAFGVVADTAGNVFVTGYTSGSLDGNAGTGGADIFVIKFAASNGTRLWSKQLGSPQTDVGKGVAAFVAPNLNPPQSGITTGYLYVAGYTDGNLDTNLNLDATFNTTDYFLAKYNSTTGQKY